MEIMERCDGRAQASENLLNGPATLVVGTVSVYSLLNVQGAGTSLLTGTPIQLP